MTTDASSHQALLEHITSSIAPASEAQRAGAFDRLKSDSPDSSFGELGQLAARLAASTHAPRPPMEKITLALAMGDHDVAWSGLDQGADAPTLRLAREVMTGRAALNALARQSAVSLLLLDCGVRGSEAHPFAEDVVRLADGVSAANMATGPALARAAAIEGVASGIAMAVALADARLDLLALGQLAAGSPPVSAAIVAAMVGGTLADVDPEDRDVVEAALALHKLDAGDPLGVLAAVGGFDLAVLTGLILGAASMMIPVLLDDHGTSAAALIAAGLAPAVKDHLYASHGGRYRCHRRALTTLGLTPIFELGLAQGEGAGAMLAVPMFKSAAALLAER